MLSKRIVVLAIDGLEPKIVQHLIKKNKLPNLKKLPFYSKLQTTTPPQSPVAWASFITSLSPQEHQLTDFVKRKPKNYQLYLAHSPKDKKPPFIGTPFWDKTKNIPTKVLFLPDTYPAPQDTKAQIISGMGTPDILGTEGSFTLFTQNKSKTKLNRGQEILLSKTKAVKTSLPGPDFKTLIGLKKSNLPLTIKTNKKKIQIILPNQAITLKEKEFSSWITLKFKAGLAKRVSALAKFYLVSLNPLKLYLSPLQINPQNPLYPISSPSSFSKKLVKKHGPFATLGLPHDTWAYDQKIFSRKAFLTQVDDLLLEKSKIIFSELKEFPSGLLVAYLGTIDTIQHMFWGNDKVINHYYQEIDKFIGKAIENLKKEDKLYILSDHGFSDFHWEFNLNTWLKKNNYLTLEKGKQSGKELLDNIDWNKTRAYALGFNSLYLNIKGRETKGIVNPKNKNKLLKKISTKLLKEKNPKNNQSVIKKTYPSSEPDLIIGYHKGHRASWATAAGGTPKQIFKKRQGEWQGDHLFDASEVPGVLFSNQRVMTKKPSLENIMTEILKNLPIAQVL